MKEAQQGSCICGVVTVLYMLIKLFFVSCTAVKGIKKQHLVEVRSLPQPPRLVKMAMESICLLIGEPTTEWKSIRSILSERISFLPSSISLLRTLREW